MNKKIASVIVVLIMGTMAVAYLGLSRLGVIADSLNNIVDKNAARLTLVQEIKSILYLQLMNEKTFILEDTKEGMASVAKLIDTRDLEIKKLAENLDKISTELGKQEVAKFLEVYSNWSKNSHEAQALAMEGKDKEALALVNTVGKPLRLEAEKLITSTTERNKKVMDEESDKADALVKESTSLMLITSLISVLLGVAVAAFVLIALGRAINAVISDLNNNTSQVNGAAQQIASASEELSQASSEQASSLEETVATIEELTSMVQMNSQNAQEAARLSVSTSEVAERGEVAIRGLVNAMSEISADSKKIEDIINVIDDIAFQTNLLALNAAVEAARAGEQGKGFAVVADAVRSLAQRSASAAKDIADLIKKSVDKIESGGRQADQCGVVLGEIVGSVKKVMQLNNEISTAGAEQANGIGQIGKAMNQLDQVTQINAASSEEAAASAEQLSAQSESLSNIVQVLTQTIRGGGEDSRPAIATVAKLKSEKNPEKSKAPVSVAA